MAGCGQSRAGPGLDGSHKAAVICEHGAMAPSFSWGLPFSSYNSASALYSSALYIIHFYLKYKPGTSQLSCHNLWQTGSGLCCNFGLPLWEICSSDSPDRGTQRHLQCLTGLHVLALGSLPSREPFLHVRFLPVT